ncbi:glycosyltransferase [Salininema proteolyticum]|uniref:Glycosyltransferase n=1 Tax=Salininema proteolyticum TaxID=1607685 RepID=A0ABV8TXK2_9ACTN
MAGRLAGKIHRAWLEKRISATENGSGTTPRDADFRERLEIGVGRLLRPTTIWRYLDPVAQRIEAGMRELVIDLAPDAIHAHDIYPLGIAVRCADFFRARGREVPVVYDSHEFMPGVGDFAPAKYTALTSYEKRYIGRVDDVVTVSPDIAVALKKHYGLRYLPKVVLNTPPRKAPDEVVESLEFDNIRTHCDLEDEERLVVYSGGAAPERRLDVIVDALAKTPRHVHLALVLGSMTAPYVMELRKQAQELGVSRRVHFLPFVPSETVQHYLRTADAGIVSLVDTQLNHKLALPNKLFEYAHAGITVIVPDLPTSGAFVRTHGIGDTFAPRDSDSLAATMTRVLEPSQAQGPVPQEILDQFSWDHQAREYADLYSAIGRKLDAAPAKAAGASVAKSKSKGKKGSKEPALLPEDAVARILLLEDLPASGDTALGDLLESHPGLSLAATSDLPRLAALLHSRGLDDRFRKVDLDTDGFASDDHVKSVAMVIRGKNGDEVRAPENFVKVVSTGLPLIVGGDKALSRFAVKKSIGVKCLPESEHSLSRAVSKALTGGFKTLKFAERRRYGTTTPWPTTPGNDVRLWMGTANFAGQLTGLAGSLGATRPDVSSKVAVASTKARVIRYAADVEIEHFSQSKAKTKVEQVEAVLGWSTHVVSDAFRPVLGWLNGKDIAADLPALRMAKKQVALLVHGSEARDPDRHLAKHPDSLFKAAEPKMLEALRRISAENRAIAEAADLPVFVTTPDLLDDLPQATWLPLIVDYERWRNEREIFERERPVVVHAPSARWTKGTEAILPVLEDMDRRGAIELKLMEGKPHHAVVRAVRESDIVVDQFSIGAYGTFACEGMAAGKAVLAYVDGDTVDRMGVEPPLVNCRAADVRSGLEKLLDDRDLARRLGADAAAFAKQYHDGTMAVQRMSGFLASRFEDDAA